MKIGASVIIDARACEVMDITPTGAILVQDVITLECRWYDYYSTKMIDPTEHPGAVLDALGGLAERSRHDESEAGLHVRAAS